MEITAPSEFEGGAQDEATRLDDAPLVDGTVGIAGDGLEAAVLERVADVGTDADVEPLEAVAGGEIEVGAGGIEDRAVRIGLEAAAAEGAGAGGGCGAVEADGALVFPADGTADADVLEAALGERVVVTVFQRYLRTGVRGLPTLATLMRQGEMRPL